jgi:SAM-dependent methyltransferase
VVELGGERHYNHARFFPKATAYVVTNVGRDYDEYRDITDMRGVPDDSEDAYLCVSVLEHVFDLHSALREIERTLKPGGHLLLHVPFAIRRHDEVDYWRLGKQTYARVLKGFEIRALAHLGGRFSVMADELQRPRGSLRLRHLPNKLLGLAVAAAGVVLEGLDEFPGGFGVHAVKRGSNRE